MSNEVVISRPNNSVSVQSERRETVVIHFQGRPGRDGLNGAPGGAAYIFTQSVEASEWIVNHNLGYYPATTILNSALSEVFADVTHFSVNQLRVNLGVPATGMVRCA